MYLIFLLMSAVNCAIIIENNLNFSSSILKFAIDVFFNQDAHFKTALILFNENDLIINQFLKEIAGRLPEISVMLYTPQNISDENDTSGNLNFKPDLTIIFLNELNYDNVEEIIFNIELLPIWYSRGNFLVVANIETEEQDWLEESFKSFWERQALKVVICYSNKQLKVVTYNPYFEKYNIDISNHQKIFPKKIHNMNGNPIKILSLDLLYDTSIIKTTRNNHVEYIGKDGKFYQTLVGSLNATLIVNGLSEIINKDFIKTYDMAAPLGPGMKTLSQIFDYDALGNSVTPHHLDDNDFLEIIFLSERNSLILVAPKSSEIPRYLYLFIIIPMDIWGWTFGSLIIVALTIYFIRKRNSFTIAFLDTYRLLINESFPSGEQPFLEKFVLMLWISYGIIFTTFFSSLLMSSLINLKYYDEINTIEDLFKTNITIVTPPYHIKFIRDSIMPEQRKVLDYLHPTPLNVTVYGTSVYWVDKYMQESNIGLLLHSNQIDYLKLQPEFANKFHITDIILFPYPMSYFVDKKKIYYEEILNVNGIIDQAGLSEFWKRYNYGIENRKNKTVILNDEEDQIVLSMDHLQLPFYLLGVGYILGMVSFVGEVVWKYICNKN